ncbi:DUF72 domain-containing protein [Sphingopyxis sp. R3-92]|uniref:DUF72 domain-containing protein n=1 Tax=Sphingopyxis sp. R3-92 TaxID=3158553 RepID=UPI003EE7A364
MALERYSRHLSCVEVNSSFYRSHQPSTWTRWAAMVPTDFRFSVKVPRSITHEHRLENCDGLVGRLLEETAGLGEKMAVLLVQLPPTLIYRPRVAGTFFRLLRALSAVRIACEPRHASWFEPEADHALAEMMIARVAADPARVLAAAAPGGWRGLSYWRLHGSPRIYRSSYTPSQLDEYSRQLLSSETSELPWCIFDNTASSAALGNALDLTFRTDGRNVSR